MSSIDSQGLQELPEALTTREAWLEPFDWYREMREKAPVRYDPVRSIWDVFQYDDVKAILADDETFSANPRNATDHQDPARPEQALLNDTMLFQDPPRHDELRAVVDDAFHSRVLDELEPRIRELTSDLLDETLEGNSNRMDIVEELSYPIPVIVIAELLGIPSDDREQFKKWSDIVVGAVGVDEDTSVSREHQQDAQEEMAMYFMRLIADRRTDPRDDLLSRIATAEPDDGSQLTHEEALGMCVLLLIAGNITTTNLITNAMRCFINHDLWDDLRNEEHLLSSALDEVLRYRSPLQALPRVATTDTRVNGETIEAGERISVWLGSANRDDRFDSAERFIPDRTPNQHLGFGYGTHYCLGAPLARLEANVVFSELLDRVRAIEPEDTTLQPTRSLVIYGVESLPIRFEPSA